MVFEGKGTVFARITTLVRALYGLKSSGAAFRAHLADHIWDIGYRPSHADADIWMRPAVKFCGFKYYEYILCLIQLLNYG